MSRSLQDTCSHSSYNNNSNHNTYDSASPYTDEGDFTQDGSGSETYVHNDRQLKRSLSVGIPMDSLCSRSAPSLIGRRNTSGSVHHPNISSSAPSSYSLSRRKPKLNKCHSLGEGGYSSRDCSFSDERMPDYWRSEDKIALEEESLRNRSSSFSGRNSEKVKVNKLHSRYKSESVLPVRKNKAEDEDVRWYYNRNIPKRRDSGKQLPSVGHYYGYDSEYSGAETEVYVPDQKYDSKGIEYSSDDRYSSEDDFPRSCIDCISLKVPSLTDFRKGDVAIEKAIVTIPIKTPPNKRIFVKSSTEGDIFNRKHKTEGIPRYWSRPQVSSERRQLPQRPLHRNQSWPHGIKYNSTDDYNFNEPTYPRGSRRVPDYNYLDVPSKYTHNTSVRRKKLPEIPKRNRFRNRQYYDDMFCPECNPHPIDYAYDSYHELNEPNPCYQSYPQIFKPKLRTDEFQKAFHSPHQCDPPQHHESYPRIPPSRDNIDICPPNTTYDDDTRQVATRIRHSSSVSINENPEYFEYDANSPPSNEPHPDADVDPSFNPASEFSQRMTSAGSSGANNGNTGKRGQLGRSLSTGEVPETEKTG